MLHQLEVVAISTQTESRSRAGYSADKYIVSIGPGDRP